MPPSSRELPSRFVDVQASVLGLDLSVVDTEALLERVRSGLEDLDMSDEICPGDHEPAVTFHRWPGQPMSRDDLCFSTISEAAQLIEAGHLSPVELTKAHLDRIATTDSVLNSFITLLADRALEQAAAAETEISEGSYRGPLHGIPIGLKDLYYTRDTPTTVGSKILRDFVPDYDAAVVERFDEAGAVLLGKLQMHEFALGATSVNSHDGPAHNPWDVSRITGGSSGGSGSAVASGQCMAALGSDTGGSIRIPAGLCGIVGMKPTYGLISRHGVHPLSWSLDTVGPMTRSARDAAIVMNALAGYDSRDPSSARVAEQDYTQGIEDGISPD